MGRVFAGNLRRWLPLAGLLLLAACVSNSSGGGGPDGSGLVTTAGGQVATGDGALTLDFPAGALSADTTVTINKVSAPTAPAELAAFADGGRVVAFDLSPSPTTFGQPVTATVALDLADLGTAGPLALPLVAVANVGADGVASPLANLTARVDTAAGKLLVSGTITHFSQLSLVVGNKGTIGVKDIPPELAVNGWFLASAFADLSKRVTNANLEMTVVGSALGALEFLGMQVVDPVELPDGGVQLRRTLQYACGDQTGTGFVRVRVTVAPAGGEPWEIDGNPVSADFVAAVSVDFPLDDPNGGVPVKCVVPSLSFASAEYASEDESGTVRVRVDTSHYNFTQAVVPIEIDPASTADEGVDYTIAPTTVTIPAGVSSAEVVVTIIEDDVAEGDETLRLRLGDPTGAVRGPLDSTVVTITDDDAPPEVSFAIPSQTSTGESGTFTVHVVLSGPSAGTVTVPYTLSGTATPGDDFTVEPADQLTIPSGATGGDLSVNVIQDAAVEGDETAVITLEAPTGAVLGASVTHTLTITGDDGAPPLPRFTDHPLNTDEALINSASPISLVVQALTSPAGVASEVGNDWVQARSSGEPCPTVSETPVGDPADEVFDFTVDWGPDPGCGWNGRARVGDESGLWGLRGLPPPDGGSLRRHVGDLIVNEDPNFGSRHFEEKEGRLEVQPTGSDTFRVLWTHTEAYHDSQTGAQTSGRGSVHGEAFGGDVTVGVGSGGVVALDGDATGESFYSPGPTGPPDLHIADMTCQDGVCPFDDPIAGLLQIVFENLVFDPAGTCFGTRPESGDIVVIGTVEVRFHFDATQMPCAHANITIGGETTPDVDTSFYLPSDPWTFLPVPP